MSTFYIYFLLWTKYGFKKHLNLILSGKFIFKNCGHGDIGDRVFSP